MDHVIDAKMVVHVPIECWVPTQAFKKNGTVALQHGGFGFNRRRIDQMRHEKDRFPFSALVWVLHNHAIA